jgi:3-oxoacyl-[acyl-carrier-protein] synthase III
MLDRGPKPWLTGPQPDDIGIKGIGYYLGNRYPIGQIEVLANDAPMREAFENRGFRFYTYSPVEEPEMALRACREALRRSRLCPADIDAVVFGWAEHRHYDDMQERLGTHIVRHLGFHNTHVLGIGMAGCCLYAELIRTGRNLIVAEGYRNVLVVEASRCNPDNNDRVIGPDTYIYSDGAAACVVTAQEPEFKLRSLVHVRNSLPNYHIVGSRCAISHRMSNSYAVLMRALRHAGASVGDIRQFFMPNAAPHQLLNHARRMRIPFERTFLANIPLIGHPWSADTAINLYSYCQFERPKAGDLFAFVAWSEGGFSTMVLERTAQPMVIDRPDFPPIQR